MDQLTPRETVRRLFQWWVTQPETQKGLLVLTQRYARKTSQLAAKDGMGRALALMQQELESSAAVQVEKLLLLDETGCHRHFLRTYVSRLGSVLNGSGKNQDHLDP